MYGRIQQLLLAFFYMIFFFSCKIHLGKSSNLQKTWLAYICIYLCILPLEKSDISINSKEFLMPFKLCTSKFFHGKNNHGVCMSNSMLPIRKEFITLLSYQSLSWRAKHTYAQYAIHTHTHTKSSASSYFFTENIMRALLSRQIQVIGLLSIQNLIRLHDLPCV